MGKVKRDRARNTSHLGPQDGKVKKMNLVKPDDHVKTMKKISNNFISNTKHNVQGVENKKLQVESLANKRKRKKSKNKFKQIQDDEVSSTSAIIKEMPKSSVSTKFLHPCKVKSDGVDFSLLWLNYKPRSTPLIKAGSDWYMQLMTEEPEIIPTDPLIKQKLKELAAEILQHDVINYNRKRGSKMQEVKFRKTVMSHGTSRDKLAAHVLRCMDSPVHSLSNLNSLIAMVTPKAKSGYEEAMSSLLELFQSTFMPGRRQAKKFEAHSFSCLAPVIVTNREIAEKQLAFWYFEDQLAYVYQKLVRQLTQVAHDTVDKNKLKGIQSLVDLLKSNPNQEPNLIVEAIINKLGDPSRKVAAQTMYWLRTLLQRQPALKIQVVTSVEVMLYRPNVNEKAQYYCLCFLKDLIFSDDDNRLAAELLKLYFGFFKACTKKGEVDTRLMSALLRGINRAFPYSRLEGSALEEKLDTLYKLCHLVNFIIATQALQLIYQVLSNKQQISDRFYQVMYRQIQDPAFGISSANSAFLNLLFKALISDGSLQRIQAFIKRLLQTTQYLNSHMTCGILYLISEVIKEKPGLKKMTQTLLQTNLNDDDGLEVFSDAEDIDEIENQEESVENINKELTDVTKNYQEKFPSASIEENKVKIDCSEMSSSKPNIFSSWMHRGPSTTALTVYDPYHRNPLYCGAEYSPVWELGYLKAHYHPSVSLFASKLINGEAIEYSGDPLQDFTLMRFLDRFVYRNPKKMTGQKDGAGGNVLGRRTQYIPLGARGIAVNSEQFSLLDPQKVPEDEHFFHRYFTQYKTRVKKEPVDEEDSGSVEDEEFDQYLGRMQGVGADDELDMDDDIDFAAGTTSTSHIDEEGLESDEDDNMSDEELDDGNEEEPSFGGGSDIDDDGHWQEFSDKDDLDGLDNDDLNFDETEEFSNDESFEVEKSMKKKKSGKFSHKPSKKKGSDSLSSMFASAETFAHLLEENAEGNMNPNTTQSMANKDRAHAKQLNWEVDRDQNMKGNEWHKKKQGKWHGTGQRHEGFKNRKARSQFMGKRGGFKKSKRGRMH
ncbi:CCAAT/enhancer-binding protein zeta-like [Homarus americanus]|uniref:CCAAT/enhancer-binding protein zeta-like n=1 Tax=Homarus americanus TaxID=6706 RepID=A0A8J5KLI3_HOMAM|nr:CCAAT/enhancer-binding protein zeta-like [Homarus americanus]